MTDLANLKATETKLEILHPGTGAPLGIFLNVLPMSDPKMKAETRRIIDQKNQAQARGKIINATELETISIQLTVAAVTGWDWQNQEIKFHDEIPEFSSAKCRELFTELDWMRMQVDELLGDTKAFF